MATKEYIVEKFDITMPDNKAAALDEYKKAIGTVTILDKDVSNIYHIIEYNSLDDDELLAVAKRLADTLRLRRKTKDVATVMKRLTKDVNMAKDLLLERVVTRNRRYIAESWMSNNTHNIYSAVVH